MDFPPRVEAVEQDVTDLKKIIEYYYRTEQQQVQQPYQQEQQYYPNQPAYQNPEPRKCYDKWTDGYQYEVNCYTGDWM